jgi:hypothetical protein
MESTLQDGPSMSWKLGTKRVNEHLWSRYHEPVSGFFTGIQAVSSDAFIVQTLEDDLKVISFRNGEVLFRKELAWTTTPALAGSSRGRLALVSKERHPLVCDIRKGEECQFERVPEYKSYEVKISDDNNVVAVSSGLDIIRTEKDEKRGWIARWGREDSILFVFRVGQLSPVATIRSHADGTVVHPSEP